jgi:hypothetical protein
MHERCVDHAEGHVGRGHVGHRAAHARRGIARHAGERHQPTHALRDGVVAGLARERAGLAEAGHRGVDHSGIHRAHRRVAQAELLGHAGQEVLDDHVRPPRQLEGQPRALGLLQIHRDPALVAVHRRERRAHPAVAAQRAQVVAAAGPLQLDDVGAQVAQQGRAIGAGDDAGEVEDADALEHGGPGMVPCPRARSQGARPGPRSVP